MKKEKPIRAILLGAGYDAEDIAALLELDKPIYAQASNGASFEIVSYSVTENVDRIDVSTFAGGTCFVDGFRTTDVELEITSGDLCFLANEWLDTELAIDHEVRQGKKLVGHIRVRGMCVSAPVYGLITMRIVGTALGPIQLLDERACVVHRGQRMIAL
jgi:hypothetical protein